MGSCSPYRCSTDLAPRQPTGHCDVLQPTFLTRCPAAGHPPLTGRVHLCTPVISSFLNVHSPLFPISKSSCQSWMSSVSSVLCNSQHWGDGWFLVSQSFFLSFMILFQVFSMSSLLHIPTQFACYPPFIVLLRHDGLP